MVKEGKSVTDKNEVKNPDPKAYPGYGRYPELDYEGMDYHQCSWVNGIVAELESKNNKNNWHRILLTGIVDFMPGWSAQNQKDFDNIKRRIPTLQIVKVTAPSSRMGGKSVYWVRDPDAYARLMKILLIEREEALVYAHSIELALGLRKEETT